MKLQFVITLFCCLSFKIFSQWSNNSSLNTPICIAANKQVDPRILEDGKGGAFIVWKDYRNSVPDVYVQRIDQNGFVNWTIDGVGACTDAADQSTPNFCSDGQGGCIVAWSDWRSGIERDLYAQRLDSSGNILWTTNGVVVTNKSNREHNEKIVSDGFGGAIVVWEQQGSNGQWDEWAQRINSNGNPMWISGGIPLSTVVSNKINGRIEADGLGGAFIVWQDFRNGFDNDIYAQHMDGQGNRLWGDNAKLICNANGTQASPKIEPDPLNGGIYTVWVDSRNNNSDIYGQRIDANGNLLWMNNGFAICNNVGNQSALDILTDGSVDGIICSWKDNRSMNYDVYAQRVNPSGIAQWASNGVPICINLNDQLNPNISIDNSGGAIISWQDSLTGNFDIRAQRVSSNGSLLWNNSGVILANAIGDQTSVKNCTDGGSGSIFVFMDKRTGTNDIYAHHLYGSGLPESLADIPTNQMDDVQVYPNPFKNEIYIQSKQMNLHDFSILTLDGKIVFSGKLEYLKNNRVIVDHLSPGVYMLFMSDNQRVFTKKIVKN